MFLGKIFWKVLVIFKTNTLKFVYLQNFVKKTKIPKFGTKIAWFGYFWVGIWKEYCHIWNHHPQFCLITKFFEKTKIPNFGTRNALFGYFWPKMPYLGVFGQEFWKYFCHIWNKHPPICLIVKFCEKQEYLILGSKMPYLGIFDQKCLIWVSLGKNFKKLLSYLKSAPSNLSNCKILRKNKNT